MATTLSPSCSKNQGHFLSPPKAFALISSTCLSLSKSTTPALRTSATGKKKEKITLFYLIFFCLNYSSVKKKRTRRVKPCIKEETNVLMTIKQNELIAPWALRKCLHGKWTFRGSNLKER